MVFNINPGVKFEDSVYFAEMEEITRLRRPWGSIPKPRKSWGSIPKQKKGLLTAVPR